MGKSYLKLFPCIKSNWGVTCMRKAEVISLLKEFSKSLDPSFSLRDFVVVDRTALLLQDVVVKETEIVDLVIPKEFKFNEFKRMHKDFHEYLSSEILRWEKADLHIGTPQSYYLVPPFDVYEDLNVDELSVRVRPLRFILRDMENYLDKMKVLAEEVDAISYLRRFYLYKETSEIVKLLKKYV